MTRRTRWLLAAAVVLVGVSIGLLYAAGRVLGSGPFAKGPDEASYADLGRLDALAEEYGLVMGRSHGAAANFAARIDGPGDEVEVLVAEGNSFDDEAVVVLRLRTEHAADGFHLLGESGADGTTRAVCYRWTFGNSIDDHEPERLDACPPGPVITVTPTPDPRSTAGG